MRYIGQPLGKAAHDVINHDIPKDGGDGGAIALGADGVVAFPFNTGGMYRGWIGVDGVPHVAIYATDALPMPEDGMSDDIDESETGDPDEEPVSKE